jgi:N-acetylmuramoyl-L-alanine amidase
MRFQMSRKASLAVLERLNDIDVMALTVYGEARGESRAGQTAVAHVIRNRAASPGWWGKDIRSVCLAPNQFSCWWEPGANRDHLLTLARALGDAREVPALFGCATICSEIMGDDGPSDPTGGADHYHATTKPPPAWAAKMTETARIGRHVFYRSKPLAKSRTVRGGQVAAGATAGSAAIEAVGEITDQTSDTLLMLTPYLTAAKWALLGLAMAGIAAMVWARVDDHRKGLR